MSYKALDLTGSPEVDRGLRVVVEFPDENGSITRGSDQHLSVLVLLLRGPTSMTVTPLRMIIRG